MFRSALLSQILFAWHAEDKTCACLDCLCCYQLVSSYIQPFVLKIQVSAAQANMFLSILEIMLCAESDLRAGT